MSENWQSKPVKATHQARRFIIYVALLVLAFLLGLRPHVALVSCMLQQSC